jgi:hypothetical protein
MSSSSTREASAERKTVSEVSSREDRAQASPVAALAVLFAVCAGVSLYATVLAGAIPDVDDRSAAGPTLDRVADAASDGGVVAPERLAGIRDRGPTGRRLNVSLVAGGRAWYVGPTVPATQSSAAERVDRVDRADRLVSVRFGPGRVEPGRLSVAVWP